MRENRNLIFTKAFESAEDNYIPDLDIPSSNLDDIIPKNLLRDNLPIPDVPEVEIVRHYTDLSQINYGVDSGIYPLGSCTMKYNPKINEKIVKLPGFSIIHPLQKKNEGAILLMEELSQLLHKITGMDAFTFSPAAGAHGELTGMFILKKFFEQNGNQKNKIIVPDSAHGTNPASAKMAGFSIIELNSNEHGEIPLEELEFAMQEGDVAGIMLTNPNTLGLFDRNILKITEIVHKYDGLCYYDGANLNPMLGICRPGDMGFDILHLNLHKTFSTPHGGGGPGSGPVGIKEGLIQFLPEPYFIGNEKIDKEKINISHSIGKMKSFWGNFGILVRAYAYIRALGKNGLSRVGKVSVLNANYLRKRLQEFYHLPYQRICQHEFVLSDKNFPNKITAEDIAKRILDYGIYAPTVYFPLIVDGALMIEPTETESKEALDYFAETMIRIYQETQNKPEFVHKAPHNTPVGRLDAVLAARKPVLKE
ncbi:MAG: aminomethyl-transferring glycine dehydrogenase subunit GcvPB [Candidatus Lokiarchaeota archaeon]|nr:aminomethyl-transferring glycine dehydrogenase subunit GcvPB [Candidatus Lokiarchaeota archaeon]MBD3199477.1 aminomethyl-transferring glycine dehydrogenase subunit GcvPB [Candidatus Lokiarchaeota archaeon]